MDSRPTEVALLSIHPRFAEAILSGTKRVEFRRRGFRRDITVVAIYATKPIGKVIGWFEVEGIDQLHPNELWTRFQNCAGIEHREFAEYYRDRSEGFAIRVRKAERLARSRGLDQVTNLTSPPQSFAYLTPDKAKKLLALPTVGAMR